MREEKGITIGRYVDQPAVRVCSGDVQLDFDFDLDGVELVLLDEDRAISSDLMHKLRERGAVVTVYGAGCNYANAKRRIDKLMDDLADQAAYNEREWNRYIFEVKNSRFVSPKHKYKTPRWQR